MTSIIIITILELLLVLSGFYIVYRICEKKAPRFDADRRCDKCGTYMVVITKVLEGKSTAIGHQCNNNKCESYGR